MQEITKTEIGWILNLINKECQELKSSVQGDFESNPFSQIVGLKHCGLTDLYQKLNKAKEERDQRLAIKNC